MPAAYFSNLNENTYMGQWPVGTAFPGPRYNQSQRIQATGRLLHRAYKERDYESRYFSYVIGNGSTFYRDQERANRLLTLPIEQIFAPENMDPQTGFTCSMRVRQPKDRYSAENTLAGAGYIGAVAPISDKFSVSGGVRVEYNRKYLKNGDPQDSALTRSAA